VFAACGLLAGLVVVGVSFTRDDAPARSLTIAPEESSSAVPVGSELEGEEDEAALPPAGSSEGFELPADSVEPPAFGGTRPRRVRSRPRPPMTAPKTSGPRITSQPRY
jgi:hypothetical protein